MTAQPRRRRKPGERARQYQHQKSPARRLLSAILDGVWESTIDGKDKWGERGPMKNSRGETVDEERKRQEAERLGQQFLADSRSQSRRRST